jgi:hypothetical protein
MLLQMVYFATFAFGAIAEGRLLAKLRMVAGWGFLVSLAILHPPCVECMG